MIPSRLLDAQISYQFVIRNCKLVNVKTREESLTALNHVSKWSIC